MTDFSSTLYAFVDLLRESGGFDLHALIQHVDSAEASSRPEIIVELSGSDKSRLTARDGELLYAIEHIAASLIRLDPEQHDRLFFDVDNFKADRERAMRRLAADAVRRVRTTATAYVFPPMMSRERRLLHLALASSGLKSASTGEQFHRSVVLYPEGVQPPSQ